MENTRLFYSQNAGRRGKEYRRKTLFYNTDAHSLHKGFPSDVSFRLKTRVTDDSTQLVLGTHREVSSFAPLFSIARVASVPYLQVTNSTAC